MLWLRLNLIRVFVFGVVLKLEVGCMVIVCCVSVFLVFNGWFWSVVVRFSI